MRKLVFAAVLATGALAAWIVLTTAVDRASAVSPPPIATQAAIQDRLDVPFVPTPQEVVDRMLELAELKEGDVLYDLGCGDGRIVVTAAKKYGVKAVGIDIDPQRVQESKENVEREGVGELVTIKQADLFQEDLGGANIITMYLLPNVNERLKPQLRKLKPGSRIISHSFSMKGAKPERIVEVETSNGAVRNLFVWTVPWEEEE